MIEVRNLTKRFGPTVALGGISFEVAGGEVLGLLGPNGAGKSTAMRVITCYIPADEGDVTVAGYSTRNQSVEVRRQIGYLPESAPLYQDMGVIEYLEFIGRVRGMNGNSLPQEVDKMIGVCGLERMAHRTIGTLSKGYRQRVGLAQAMIHDPQVLVLDEPTTGLDPNQIVEIRELIRRVGQQKTIILSTHILPEVETTCSRVLIINEGLIVASGTPAELAGQSEGEQKVMVTIQAPAEVVEPVLRESGLASDLHLVDMADNMVRYAIGTNRADPEEKLFTLAVEQGWVLTELKRETMSLEQVFTRLTTREPISS
jgi:ABC-2 type transport system ATP-binding protein